MSSWSQFVETVSPFSGSHELDRWCFRGQANASWDLTPSLVRVVGKIDPQEALRIESFAVERFKREAHLRASVEDLPRGSGTSLEWLALMQHHRCPTRLLDWTSSPYVAAYFAVNDLPNCGGAVWIFPRFLADQKIQDSPVLRRWLNHPLEESNNLHAIRTVSPSRPPLRIVIQQGLFTFCSHILDDHGRTTFRFLKGEEVQLLKIVIPAKLKAEFQSRLWTMNLTGGTLFPDLDGLGRATAELISLQVRQQVEDE